MKHNITDRGFNVIKSWFYRGFLLLSILLALGVGEMWGEPYIEVFGLQFYESSTNRYFKTGSEIKNDLAFGNKTSDFKLVYVYANAKKNGGNLCGAMYFKWWLEGTDGASNSGGVGYTSNSWSGDYCYEKFGTENGSSSLNGLDFVQNRRPGNYTFKFYFSFEGNNSSSGCGTWYDCKYSGGDFKFTYTIPDPTITITGADALVAGTSTNIQAAITNYPVGSKITKVRVTGNIASAKETTGSATSMTVSSVTPNASGSNGITVTVTVKFGTGGTKDYTYNYNVTPPAVSDFTITPSGTGYLSSGSGTEGSPYLVTYNGTITFGLSGATKAYADGNASAQYSTDGTTYGTTGTYISKSHTSVTATTNQNWVYKARLKNNSSALYGSIKEKTVYWKVPTYTVTLNMNGSYTSNGTSTATHGRTSLTSITAPTRTGYEVEGYYKETACTTKVATPAGALSASTSYTDASNKWSSLSNQTLYAKWTAKKYDVTLKANGGSGSDQVVQATYDAAMPTTLKSGGGAVTVHTKTGYNLTGYWDTSAASGGNQYYSYNAGTSTLSSYRTWNKTSNTSLYARWSAKTYAITLNQQTAVEGYGSSGTVTCPNATYNSTAPTLSGTVPTAANGYAFMGFYTGTLGTGKKLINADKSWVASVTGYTDGSKKWIHDGAVTLYAYYKKAEITDITLSPGAVFAPVEAGADDSFVTATPTVEPTPAGTTTICWENLLYENDNPVPGDHAPIVVAGNTVKYKLNGLAPGNYHIRAVLHKGGDCSGDVLDTYDKTITIATDFKVTVRYMCGAEEIKASEIVDAHATEYTSISAPNITGYAFSTWDLGDGGIEKHSSDALTKQTGFRFKATYNGTLTAVYTKRKYIYLDLSQKFSESGKWSNPYCYLYNSSGYWDDTEGAGATGANCVKKGAMTQIGSSKIWYFDYTDAADFIAAGNNGKLAFTWGDKTGQANFGNVDAIYRTDFSEGTPLFIPAVGQNSEDKSTTCCGTGHYYNKGYWTNYVGAKTGYTLLIYNSSDVKIKEIPFTSVSNDMRMTMKATVDLEAQTTYKVEVYRDNDHYYKNNTARTYDNSQDNWEYNESGEKGTMITTAAGDYVFTLSCTDYNNNKDFKIRMKIDYPAEAKDFQVLYYDNATWSGTSGHALTWRHPSRIIKARANGVDTISFFVAKGNSPTLYARKVSSITAGTGAITWASIKIAGADSKSLTVDSTAVWNFKVTQSSTAGTIQSIENIGAYTGEYYIRCDAMNSKWDNYTTDHDHRMTYSSFSESDENAFGEKFSHYKAKWCRFGKNVKFVIANDYSPCISDTLIQDNGNPYNNINSDGFLKDDGNPEETANIYSANIRFMWNRKTNKISRAYVASSTNPERLFLVLRGNYEIQGLDRSALEDEGSGKPSVILLDDQNWIYEEILYIKPGTRFKLYACYAQASANPNGAQYFRGAYESGAWAEDNTKSVILIDGDGGYQKVRVLYDFKTNRLICAWLPDGNVSGDLHINSDVMIIREHQEPASYLSFANASSQLSGVKTVYGVMKFNRWVLNNRKQTGEHGPLDVGDQKSIYERSLYFISFPFDVRVSDIFGFGRYWDEWYLEYYDGLTRAKNGFWIDSPPNWKYIYPSEATNYVLKANVGYILGLDLDYMAYNNLEFWAHNIETIELFFPSTASLETLKQTTCTIPELGDEYLCTINRTGIDGDRRVKDSYWRCIGVPSLNLYNTPVSDGSGNITWKTDYTWYEDKREFPFIYMWNKGDNTLTPQATSTFTFLPMHSYLVQNGKKIIWTNVSAKSSIVARRAKEEDYTEYNWRLALMSDTTLVDQTYVRMSELEQVTDSFDFGQDLSKDFNANRSDLYTISNDARLAANSMPLKTESTTIVPVGVRIKKEGEFTLAMPDGTYGVSITLVDNYNGTRTELGAGFTYTFASEVGLFDDRFHLEIAKVKSVATGVEVINGENGENGVRKVMINGILYIVRGKHIYDARGIRVE